MNEINSNYKPVSFVQDARHYGMNTSRTNGVLIVVEYDEGNYIVNGERGLTRLEAVAKVSELANYKG